MYQDNAKASTAAVRGSRADMSMYPAPPPAVDVPNVAGVRRGFEGLIIDRGRPHNPHSRTVSMLPGRTRSAAAGGTPVSLKAGVAASTEQIAASNRLISERYAWRGYSYEADDNRTVPAGADESRREITFLVSDAKATMGTVTLRLDGPGGLLAEATHGAAARRVRADGRRVGELTRLAVADCAESRVVLASLFGLVYTVGRMECGLTDVLIEVNPRHTAFYIRAIGFVVAGDEVFCERVGAPSVLLHLDVEILESRLWRAAREPIEEPLARYGT